MNFPNNPTIGQEFGIDQSIWRWDGLRWKTIKSAPASHKSSHATGGVDALTPADIGAATAAQGTKADSALQTGTAISTISGLQTALDGKQASGSYAPAGNISPSAITGTAVVTSDQRLSDSRQPTLHKSSHATGGADALAPADIGAIAKNISDTKPVNTIRALTSIEYDALASADPNTIYFII